MSDTIVDMAKVTQAMDAGFRFILFKNGLGSYSVIAEGNRIQMARLSKIEGVLDEDGDCITDDFTPEQALTRMAYKVHGEILDSRKNGAIEE